MSKQVTSSLVLPDPFDYQPGGDIKFPDWDTLNDAMNHLYARGGTVVQGMSFREPYETTSATYAQANNAAQAAVGLENWCGFFRFSRKGYQSGLAAEGYSITLNAYLQNLDLRATLVRFNDGIDGDLSSSTTSFSLTASSTSGDSEWASAELEVSAGNAVEQSTGTFLAHFLVYVEARHSGTSPGKLWNFALRETILTGSTLPRSG